MEHTVCARMRTWVAGAILCSAISGCAGGAGGDVAATGAEDHATSLPETVTNSSGALFLRKDLWTEEDLASLDTPPEDASDVERLAWGLRGHMLNGNGGYYIELEPPLALAERILYDETPAATVGGYAPPVTTQKAIISGDGRSLVSSSTGGWQAALAMMGNACSGTRLGTDTMVTAAHCIYNTVQATGPDGWICRDGTFDNSGSPCWGIGFPLIRFGVNDNNGHSNWFGCFSSVTINSNFASLSSLSPEQTAYQFAGYDHAVFDLTVCPESTWPSGTESFGTSILGNTSLANLNPAYAPGYPARVFCGSGDLGQIGFQSGSSVAGSDCPGTGNWPGSTWQYNSNAIQYSGGELWRGSTGDVSAGDYNSANTIRSLADITDGQSGGPLYYFDGSTRYLIGILSNHDSSENRYSRWNSSLHNWVDANSPFPSD